MLLVGRTPIASALDSNLASKETVVGEAMLFPQSPRVIYEKNPLEEVICQLRFPPILRIDSEIPAAFQEAIRGQYPLFTDQATDTLLVPKEISKLIGKDFPIRVGNPTFNFTSADELWKVTLTRDFLALTCLKYVRWEDFKTHLALPLEVFENQYSPAFYSRIGLRYKDVIRRSKLGLEDAQWAELLKPHIAGTLGLLDFANAVKRAVHNIVIDLDGGSSQVRIRHGLAQENGNGEVCYLVDSDFFTKQRMEKEYALEKLDTFNKSAGRLFRWCITDRLHKAMGPRSAK